MKRIVLLGAPGAGKGTQAERLARHLEITHVSTGQLFRDSIAAGTELGKLAAQYIDNGNFVPDEVTNPMVEEYLGQLRAGFLLDGYPRTAAQAEELKGMLTRQGVSLDVVLNIAVPEDVVVTRLLHRAEVENRADDTEPVIRHRIDVYHQQTEPMIDYYRNSGLMCEVDGTGSVDEVWDRIRAALKI